MLRELVDDDWVEVTSPPRYADGGRLVTLEDVDGMRRVVVDGDADQRPAVAGAQHRRARTPTR